MGFAQASPTPVYEDNTACIEWGSVVIGGRERAKHRDSWKHRRQAVNPNGDMGPAGVLPGAHARVNSLKDPPYPTRPGGG